MRRSRWAKSQGGARIHTQRPALDRTRRREQHALIAWVRCALDRRDTAGRLVLLMESGLRSSPSHPGVERVDWPQGLSVPTLVNIGEPAHGQMNTQEMHHFDWQAAEPLVFEMSFVLFSSFVCHSLVSLLLERAQSQPMQRASVGKVFCSVCGMSHGRRPPRKPLHRVPRLGALGLDPRGCPLGLVHGCLRVVWRVCLM